MAGTGVSHLQLKLEEQINKVRKIYYRQISIPLSSTPYIFDQYEKWEMKMKGEIPLHIRNTYNKSLKLYNDRFPFEEELISPPPSSTENSSLYSSVYLSWKNYLLWEEKKKVFFFNFNLFFFLFNFFIIFYLFHFYFFLFFIYLYHYYFLIIIMFFYLIYLFFNCYLLFIN